MRRARQNDYWRAIERGQGWKVKIQKLAYTNVKGIGTGELEFGSPVNFICGPNGVGKTTLLRAIGASVAPFEAKDSPSTQFRLSGGSASIAVCDGEEKHTIEVDFSNLDGAVGWADVEILHVDTSSVVSELQNYFCKFPNIQDALNGVPVFQAVPVHLETLRFMTNIPYSAISVYTLEETRSSLDGEQTIIERPFFEVCTTGGADYDSRSMGLGELATFYLWWSLERATERTVLLVEEPESFLSPLCQTAFAATLAKCAATKKPFVVVTTHSPQIIETAPRSSLIFIYRDGPDSKMNQGEPLDVLLRTVGIVSKVRVLILVEDNAARLFCKLWIAEFSPRSAQSVEICMMGGDGNVMKALKAFPENPKALDLIGLLDGDAEAKGFAGKRVAFLPGGKPIEALYRDMVETDIDRVEPILGIQNLRQIVFSQGGMELHEWFEGMKENSNLSHDQLHLVLFKAWIQKPENRNLAERYFGALRQIIEG